MARANAPSDVMTKRPSEFTSRRPTAHACGARLRRAKTLGAPSRALSLATASPRRLYLRPTPSPRTVRVGAAASPRPVRGRSTSRPRQGFGDRLLMSLGRRGRYASHSFGAARLNGTPSSTSFASGGAVAPTATGRPSTCAILPWTIWDAAAEVPRSLRGRSGSRPRRRRGPSLDDPGRGRGGAAVLPRTIQVAAAASPRRSQLNSARRRPFSMAFAAVDCRRRLLEVQINLGP